MKVAHRARMRAKLSMAPGTRLKVALGEAFGRRLRWFGFDLAAAPDETIYFRGRADMEFRRQMQIEWDRTIADARTRGCEVHEYQDELTIIEPAGEDRWVTLADLNVSLPPWATPAQDVRLPDDAQVSFKEPGGEWQVARYQK